MILMSATALHALAHSAGLPNWLTNGLEQVRTKPREVAVTGRIPYTYAYDYLRQHHEEFGLTSTMGRGETAAWLTMRLEPDHRDYACALLTAAYLEEWDLTLDEEGQEKLRDLLAAVPA